MNLPFELGTAGDLSLAAATEAFIQLEETELEQRPQHGWASWFASKLEDRKTQLRTIIVNHVVAQAKQLKGAR